MGKPSHKIIDHGESWRITFKKRSQTQAGSHRGAGGKKKSGDPSDWGLEMVSAANTSLPLIITPAPAGSHCIAKQLQNNGRNAFALSNCTNPHQHLPGGDFSPPALQRSQCRVRPPVSNDSTHWVCTCLASLPPALNEPCYVSSASIFIKNLTHCQFALLPAAAAAAAAISIFQRKGRHLRIIYRQQLLSGLHLLKYIQLKRGGSVDLRGEKEISACWEKL